MTLINRIFNLTLLVVLLAACDQSPPPISGPVYKASKTNGAQVFQLAIHPLHNPRKLTEAYQPLIDYLNQHITDAQFELEASRDYPSYEVKFRDRKPALLLPNPWQTLEAMKVGYRVISMAGDAADFKGIFIVRRDSGIENPIDLKGRIVSYPSPTALAASIMPQRFLHDNGININQDIENQYVGSQESSIMNVLLGTSAAGATWPPPWRLFQRDRPTEAVRLKVIWETPSLMNNSVMVRDDLPIAIGDQVSELIHGLHDSDAGRAILSGMATARFYPANDDSYQPVRDFVAQFEKEVRSVE
jgi:phosphonate transport system substrate-binding protein